MTLTTKDLSVREDGNLLLTVTQGQNSMTVVLATPMILQALKIDLNRATAAQTLARDANDMFLDALTSSNLNKEKIAEWMKKYNKLMVRP